MFRLSTVALAAMMFLPGALAAQTTTGTDTGTGTVTGPVLDLGKPVDTGPRVGDRYSREAYGDWQMACVKTEGETDPCSLLQVLADPGGNPMAEFSLFRLANGGAAIAGATVIVPLETLLPAQLTIAVDGGVAKRYNYTFCNPVGCIAQIGFTEDDVAAFKRGAKATLTLVPAPAPDQQINLELSLKGFTAGYAAVDVVEN